MRTLTLAATLRSWRSPIDCQIWLDRLKAEGWPDNTVRSINDEPKGAIICLEEIDNAHLIPASNLAIDRVD
jgi:hypothetical protein